MISATGSGSSSFGQPNGLSMKERFDRANHEVNLVALCESLGMDVKYEAGIPFVPCCFHEDVGRRNMAIYSTAGDRVTYPRGWCFSCKTLASPIDLVKKQQGTDAYGALKIIESFIGGVGQVYTHRPARERNKPQETKDLRPALDMCIERLWSDTADGAACRRYLDSRLLLEVAPQYQFGLWFDDNSYWSNRLVIPYLTSDAAGTPVYSLVGRDINHTKRAGPVADSSKVHAGSQLAGKVRENPKYLYTSAQSREPYNWSMVHRRLDNSLEQDLPLLICEGELDAASVLYATGGHYPTIALGGAGAVKNLMAHSSVLAGLTCIYIRDRDIPNSKGEVSTAEAARRAIQALSECNATVHEIIPPEIEVGGKSDMNSMLVAYGADGLAEWLTDRVGEAVQQEVRSLV